MRPVEDAKMHQYQDKSLIHFHIRWRGESKLDWECFETREEATERAASLAQPNEVFAIEEISARCPLRKARVAAAG